jgi:hypothetical protein
MTYFTEQVVKVNGSGLVAERASVSFESPLQQIQGVGYKGSNATSLFGPIRGNAQISYLVQTSNEPFYDLIKDLRTKHTVNYTPINLQIGDITGAFFVESVNYSITHGDLVKADVSLVTFETTSSGSVDKTVGYVQGDFAYGIYSAAQLRMGETNRVFDFSYSFRANWQPIYKLGSKIPMQVQLLDAEERAVFNHETWVHQHYTGEFYSTVSGFVLAGTGLARIVFPIESGIVRGRTIQVQNDDVARVETTVTRVF